MYYSFMGRLILLYKDNEIHYYVSWLSINHVGISMQKNRLWTIILLAINLYLGVISHHYLFLE